MTALKDLLATVEAGTVGQWFNWNSGIKGHGTNARLAYNGSLDAAMALHEAVLPGWGFCVTQVGANVEGSVEAYYSDNINPARAWLIAIIRALIAQECEA